MSAAEILEQIRRLPEKERLEVTERILEEFGYLDNDPSSEQIEEMERRADWLRRHPESGIPWEQVRAELKERLKRRACAAK
jgi:putative addiction module component (TIGR02574 family)